MIITTFHQHHGEWVEGKFKKTVIGQYIIGHDELIKLIENPVQVDLNNYQDIDTAKKDQVLIFYGDLINRSNKYQENNWGIRHAIVLDYDKDVTIGNWVRQFEGKFRYYLYTSFKNTRAQHRFRVIIPVDRPFIMTNDFKKILLSMFVGVDESTFHNRAFYGPSYHDKSLYCKRFGDGPVFSIDTLDAQVAIDDEINYQWILFHPQKKYNNLNETHESIKVNKIKYIQNRLSETNWLHKEKHMEFFKILGFFKKNKFYFTNYEIQDIISSHPISKSREQQLKDFLQNQS